MDCIALACDGVVAVAVGTTKAHAGTQIKPTPSQPKVFRNDMPAATFRDPATDDLKTDWNRRGDESSE